MNTPPHDNYVGPKCPQHPPEGYRFVQIGEMMLSTDLFWAYEGEWKEGADDDYPYNESYRPMIRRL